MSLGNERGTSVIEVIQAVKNVTGKEFAVAYEDRRSGDPAILVGGCGKAKRVLGWEPVYPEIEQIVAHAWNWSQNAQF